MKIWHISLSLLVIILCSCDNFVLKKENKDEIIKEGLNKLNWNEVEQPPLFKICEDKIEEKLELCFQNTITEHIHDYLSQQTITVKEVVNDTIWVPLLITKNGKINLEDFNLPSSIEEQIPELKDILEKSIASLPKVEPAHTRSTPVSARYRLPLIIGSR